MLRDPHGGFGLAAQQQLRMELGRVQARELSEQAKAISYEACTQDF